MAGGFKDFVYWNWDKKPSKNDNIVKAMDWIDIAEAVSLFVVSLTLYSQNDYNNTS